MTPIRKCRSPLCERGLRKDNKSGFCRVCQKSGPGKRWFLGTRPDFYERIERRLASERAFRERRRAKGLCVECYGPGRPGLSKCEWCQDIDTIQQRERRHARERAAA